MAIIRKVRVHDRPMPLNGRRTRDAAPNVRAEVARFRGGLNSAYVAEREDDDLVVYATSPGADVGETFGGGLDTGEFAEPDLGVTGYMGPPGSEDPRDMYLRTGGPRERLTGQEFDLEPTDRRRMSFGDLARAERAATGKVLTSINDRNRAFWARGGRN